MAAPLYTKTHFRAEVWQFHKEPMFDINCLNRMTINLMAAHMLESVGRKPEPHRLYFLDLVFWSLEQGHAEVEKSVSETIYAMASWRPQRIMNFLDLLPGQEYNPEGWESAQTPIDLALLVLKDIEDRMFVKFPWYGSFES